MAGFSILDIRKYPAYAIILGSAALLVTIAIIFNSAFAGMIIGAAAGSFTFNDPLILLLCIVIGAGWYGRSRYLIISLISVNVVYRLWLSASNIVQYKHIEDVSVYEPTFFSLFVSSYGALLVGYLSNLLICLVTTRGKHKSSERQP